MSNDNENNHDPDHSRVFDLKPGETAVIQLDAGAVGDVLEILLACVASGRGVTTLAIQPDSMVKRVMKLVQ